MINIIIWFCAALFIFGLHQHWSKKFNLEIEEKNKELDQREQHIARELHVLDLKKEDYEADLAIKARSLKQSMTSLDQFREETYAIIDNDKMAKQELADQNAFLKKQITKLKIELHNARQRSKRLAKNTKNTL